MREVLRRPGVGVLFAGEVASMFGDSVMLLVLMIWVKTLTGSSGLAGAVMLTITVPALFGPLLGWLIDRFRRRPFLIAANILSGLALLPLLAVHDRSDVWIIYVVGACYGLSFTVTGGAFAGLVKELVPAELLGSANGLFGTVQQGFRLIGPLIGAGLFAAIGGRTVAIIDIVSFGVAALALTILRVAESRPERSNLHWVTEMMVGVHYIRASIALRRTTIAMSVALLMLGATESLIFAYVGTGLHRTPTFIGVLITAQGIGGLIGAVLAGRIISRLGELVTVAFGLFAFAVSVALLTYPLLAVGLVALPFSGAGIALATIGFGTLMQTRTPGPLMGRVSTAANALMSAAQAVSVAAGAVLVSIVDYRILFAGMAVVMAGAGAYLWSSRSAGRLDPVEAEPAREVLAVQ